MQTVGIVTALQALALAPPSLMATLHGNGVLELILNRPTKLHALSSELVDALSDQVQHAQADSVKAVLLSATRCRAFCAGGDIRQVSQLSTASRQDFLHREYTLMLKLHQLAQAKPVIAFADGYIIGAGGGLFMAAGTRIVTPASTLSMPECVLGIVPDCGATDFLSRLPSGELRSWAALCGARLDADLMAASGLATHVVDGSSLEAFRKRLLCGGSLQRRGCGRGGHAMRGDEEV